MLLERLPSSLVSQITDAKTSDHILQKFNEGVLETCAIQDRKKEWLDIGPLNFFFFFEILWKALFFIFDFIQLELECIAISFFFHLFFFTSFILYFRGWIDSLVILLNRHRFFVYPIFIIKLDKNSCSNFNCQFLFHFILKVFVLSYMIGFLNHASNEHLLGNESN